MENEMNPIIQSYMNDFAECTAMDKMDQSILFEHFINNLIVQKDFSDDFDFNKIHVGGKGDNGIDGIAIVINQEVLDLNEEFVEEIIKSKKDFSAEFLFIQSKTSDSLELGEVLKFLSGVDGFFDNDSNIDNDNIKKFIKIKDCIYSKSSNFACNPRLYLKYVYTGKKDSIKKIEEAISKQSKKFESMNLFSEVSIEILDFYDIQGAYREITLNIKKEIELEKVTTLPKIENIQESYIGIIPVKEFIKLISDENGKIIKNLFYDNVRDYQGDTKVNLGIADTLTHKGKYFGVCHNGITIISKTLKKTGNTVHLENFQIVNGCQTSQVIMKNKNALKQESIEDIFIPIKLIVSTDENILSSIIVAANTMNEVKSEAFESLDKFHKGLEDFYVSKGNKCPNLRFYYERRSKQYSSNDEVSKQNIVTLAEQVKSYLSMFHNAPQSTHRYYGELLKTYKDSIKMFQAKDKQEYFELYHIAGVASQKLMQSFCKGKIYKKYKPYRYHILFLSKLLMSEKLSDKLTKKEYQKECNKIYEILGEDEKLQKIFIKSCSIIKEVLRTNCKDCNPYEITRIKQFTTDLRSNWQKSNRN